MQLNLFFYALAMLCSLASVAFVTLDVRALGWLGAVIGFVLGARVVRPSDLPDPVWIGMLVAILAVAGLVRPRAGIFAAAAGGLLAGIWVSLLQLEGLPLWAAVPVAGAPAVTSAILARWKPDFAPLPLREEALVVVFALAIVVAAAPSVVAGWQSAVGLNLQHKEVAAQIVPAWTLLLTCGAATLGGLYTVWMRR